MGYDVTVRTLAEGGKISSEKDKLVIEGADTVTLLLAGETTHRRKDPAATALEFVDDAAKIPYETLRESHIKDHRKFFQRVSLELGGPTTDSELAKRPTDERLKRVKKGGDDPSLITQFFQFGRYLLIASSRPGTRPANLQGIWADGLQSPWDADYHMNINLQMNYWPAETTNLAELHEPLFDLLESLREPGRKTAKIHYGARGFVAHHLTDMWGCTTPADGAQWGLWPTGPAWLCSHLWGVRSVQSSVSCGNYEWSVTVLTGSWG